LVLVSADAFGPNVMRARSARSSIVRAASPDNTPDAAVLPVQATTTSNGVARFFAFTAAASVFAFHPISAMAAPMDVCKYTHE
jgi:hypothetical protein